MIISFIAKDFITGGLVHDKHTGICIPMVRRAQRLRCRSQVFYIWRAKQLHSSRNQRVSKRPKFDKGNPFVRGPLLLPRNHKDIVYRLGYYPECRNSYVWQWSSLNSAISIGHFNTRKSRIIFMLAHTSNSLVYEIEIPDEASELQQKLK